MAKEDGSNLLLLTVMTIAPKLRGADLRAVMARVSNVPFDPNTRYHESYMAILAEARDKAEPREDKDWEKERDRILRTWGVKAIPAPVFSGLGVVERREARQEKFEQVTFKYPNVEVPSGDPKAPVVQFGFSNICYPSAQQAIDGLKNILTSLTSLDMRIYQAGKFQAEDMREVRRATEYAKNVIRVAIASIQYDIRRAAGSKTAESWMLKTTPVCFGDKAFVVEHEKVHSEVMNMFPPEMVGSGPASVKIREQIVLNATRTFLEEAGPKAAAFYQTYCRRLPYDPEVSYEEVLAGVAGAAVAVRALQRGTASYVTDLRAATVAFNSYLKNWKRGVPPSQMQRLEDALRGAAEDVLIKNKSTTAILLAFRTHLRRARSDAGF